MNKIVHNTSKNTIILVRHGEATYNQKGIIQGQTNYSRLTSKGVQQAEIIGRWLKGINVNAIYSSPLDRAVQTARIISKEIGFTNLEITTNPQLIEIDFGVWVGRNKKEVASEYKEEYLMWRNKPYDFLLNKRYPVRELYEQLEDVSQELFNSESRIGTRIIVGHRGTVSGLVIKLLKLPKSHHHFLQVDQGSVTIIQERNRTNKSVEYELFCANERPSADPPHLVDFDTEERTKSFGEVFLVRHGQTKANIKRKYQGGKNVGLSKIGKANMQFLAKSFIPRFPTRLVSSPLKRASESANILSNEFGIKTISERKDLHEFLYGVWEGMSEKDVQKYRSVEYNQWKITPVKTNIPEAEHINDAYNRCRGIWEDYENDVKVWGGSVIIVSHDIVNRLLICNALDLPANYIWRFKQTNASISVIAVKNSYDGKLRMLNHNPYPILTRLKDEWL